MEPERDAAGLLSELKAGKPAALTVVYKQYSGLVYRIAFQLTESAADAGDVTQDVFIGLPEALSSLTQPAKLEQWLRQTAARNSLMRLRQRRRRREVSVALLQGLFARADPVLTRVELENAISQLPEPLRLVFILRELEGFTYAEIAETLGIRQGLAEVRLYRARKRLRKSLSGNVQA
ncbi:MAG: sigma-70 family RNA polymerase sigma factor [Gemmatimonadota bacterium]